MIPRTVYAEEHTIFRDSVRRFVDSEIVPHHEQWEEDGAVPRDAWKKAGEAGFLLNAAPEEYGGGGGDFLSSAVIIEEMARVGATGPGFTLHSDIVAPYILHYGSEAQKREWLPKMAAGETITAIAMSEPGTGSDLQGVQTRAVMDGNELVLNGQKTFITTASSPIW